MVCALLYRATSRMLTSLASLLTVSLPLPIIPSSNLPRWRLPVQATGVGQGHHLTTFEALEARHRAKRFSACELF